MVNAKSLILAACMVLGIWAVPTFAADGASGSDAVKRRLADDAKCTRCHDANEAKPILSLYQTKHGTRGDARAPNCTSCHGASESHLKDKRSMPDVVFAKSSSGHQSSADAQSQQCMTCHKSGLRAHWDGSQHQSQDMACANCHTVHASADPVLSKRTQQEVCFTCHKDQRAQTHRISTHPLAAGKMSCSDCHNPHGSTGPKLLAKGSTNETCYSCHAEKRGPFLWEHSPVVDDCANCHTPHGSTNPSLLKTRVPMVCQECHSGDHGKNLYSGANLPKGSVVTVNGLQGAANLAPPAQLNGRGCINCHSIIHGSNHPAGAKFQR